MTPRSFAGWAEMSTSLRLLPLQPQMVTGGLISCGIAPWGMVPCPLCPVLHNFACGFIPSVSKLRLTALCLSDIVLGNPRQLGISIETARGGKGKTLPRSADGSMALRQSLGMVSEGAEMGHPTVDTAGQILAS